MRPQPLICVRDVDASSRWYQRLFDCQSAHGGPEYERLVSNGQLVLQLHRWDMTHDHGAIGDPDLKPYGRLYRSPGKPRRDRGRLLASTAKSISHLLSFHLPADSP
jgi:hypothetical protein